MIFFRLKAGLYNIPNTFQGVDLDVETVDEDVGMVGVHPHAVVLALLLTQDNFEALTRKPIITGVLPRFVEKTKT